ncbi:hypothetical protein [Streptomyces sp. NPDC055109]
MEQITARSYPAEAERRIITPLRLTAPPSRAPASPFPCRTAARTPRTAPTSPRSTRAWPTRRVSW